jgi:L-ascorbate metabolism protein UlaG (beta-lactamase superfamily)
MKSVQADIVTISHQHHDHSCLERINGDFFVINEPGEYEIKGVSIFGIPSFHDQVQGGKRGRNTIYIYDIDNLKLVHLGDLGCQLTDKQISQINEVDILMIPVGGIYTLDAKGAVAVVEQLEPKIIIPMHYKTKDLLFKLNPITDFLKEIGKEDVRPIDKLKVTSFDLLEERRVVWLKK